MRHMIKWLKISAAINIYLSIVLTFVLVALVVDVWLDAYWHSDVYIEQIREAMKPSTEL